MKYFFVYVFLFLNIALTAQNQNNTTYIYQGIVVNQKNEPIPFVNIFVENTKDGTTSDSNGKFKLKTQQHSGYMVFSFLGYQNKKIKLIPNKKFYKVTLVEDENILNEITLVQKPQKRVKKKESKVYPILKEIWKRRKQNALRYTEFYSYKNLETTEMGLNRIDTLFLKTLFRKDYKSILQILPNDTEGSFYFFPLYIKEVVYQVYSNKKKKHKKIIAEKTNGFESEGFVFERMNYEFKEVDIYKNSFNITNSPFISPISPNSYDTYDYVLYDTIKKNGKTYFNIYFFPRRDEDLAFEGNFLVADKNFLITEIKMKLKNKTNLNFIRGIYIEKKYQIINDSLYLPLENTYEGDYSLMDKKDHRKGFVIKKKNKYFDYQLNKKFSDNIITKKKEKRHPDQYEKKQEYWEQLPVDISEKETYQLIDKIKDKRIVKNITTLSNAISTGYVHFAKNLQFGPLYQLIGKNSVEEWRLKGGFRTFKNKNDKIRLHAYMAYGVQDQKIKYGIQFEHLLSHQPRILLTANFIEDYEQQSRYLLKIEESVFTELFSDFSVFSRNENYFLSHIKKKKLKLDFQIIKNLHTGIIPFYKTIQPANEQFFNMDYYTDNGIQSSVTDVGVSMYVKFTPFRYVYGTGVKQEYGENPYPTFILKFQKNFKNLGSDFNYEKVQFKYTHFILLGKFGASNLSVDAGKTFGTVPLALLNPIPTNQTMILNTDTFNLLNYYDFITDTYVVGHFEHHFLGFIFNKIPLMKKLKLRGVTSFRIAYGSISNANKSINFSNLNYTAPENKPYYEYGIGIENLGIGNFRFFRIDAIWRSSYQSPNGLYSPKFGVRIDITPRF